MITAGLTGGIGSGKSTVAKVFNSLGVPVYNADSEAKKMYDIHSSLLDDIRKKVSPDVFDENGKLDKKKLAEAIFSDKDKLKAINGLVHPLVKKDFINWQKKHSGVNFIILESAILFESGFNTACDTVITVFLPEELRIQRLRERDRKNRADIEKIIASQISEEEKMKRSDYVIKNDEVELIIPQVLALNDILSKSVESKIKEVNAGDHSK
ncbi:MAG: dephospho-CoA kinase [Bacteroidetes bacterium]|nr:MAG: dephospho-CoA kinase [Bacteroidota bacterium]